jgi:hypothetical protein
VTLLHTHVFVRHIADYQYTAYCIYRNSSMSAILSLLSWRCLLVRFCCSNYACCAHCKTAIKHASNKKHTLQAHRDAEVWHYIALHSVIIAVVLVPRIHNTLMHRQGEDA